MYRREGSSCATRSIQVSRCHSFRLSRSTASRHNHFFHVRPALDTDCEDSKTSISESIEDIEDNPTILHYPSCSDPSTSNPGRHKRKTCRHCKKTTKYFCDGCPPDHRGVIGLCPECFRAYHGH